MPDFPTISIVTTVFKKEKEIRYFLEAIKAQHYAGKWEVIMYDDNSPDNSSQIVEKFIPYYERIGIGLTLIKNKENLGQCICRNKGVKRAVGDIIVIIDSDCIMDVNYLANIYTAFSKNDCDVVIGPLNIESNNEDINVVITSCRNVRVARKRANMQDSLNKRSFVNLVTRNFSIRKRFIREELFDPAFSHIATDPTTGFGWDDIEMGYRLFKRGARIKYCDNVYTVHMTHPDSIDNTASIPLRSLKNFRKMHQKHPDMKNIARRWVMETYGKILNWCKSYKHDLSENEDYLFLEDHFKQNIPYIYELKNRRRLKILTYCWHVPHQYELYKLPHDFTLIRDIGTHHCYNWGYRQRPFPENAVMKNIHDINQKDYDLAIFHFDENCLYPEHSNNVLNNNWGLNLRYFMSSITDIPKIGICHGTPQFYGAYNANYTEPDLMEPIEEARLGLVNYLKDMLIICNSHQAEREWNFEKSRVIWHGMDPTEFPRATYDLKVLGLTNMLGRPHYRGYYILNSVNQKLPPDLKVVGVSVREPAHYSNKESNEYAFSKFRKYVDAVRKYSIYFNPTVRSPMPRSRTEAMMCGLVTVSYKSHDVDMFIKNKVNGFYSEDVDELVDFIIYLARNDSFFKKVADESYKTAIDIFNHDRYLHEWQDTIFRLV